MTVPMWLWVLCFIGVVADCLISASSITMAALDAGHGRMFACIRGIMSLATSAFCLYVLLWCHHA